MEYIIKPYNFDKDNKIKLTLKKSYNFYFNNDEYLVKLYDNKLICNYLENKYQISYKKILELLIYIYKEDEDDDEAFNLVLDEVSRLETLILTHFNKFLPLDVIKKMLKELFLVKQDLRNKMIKTYNRKGK